MTTTSSRYAIYWAPRQGGALAEFGARWLGRDAETGEIFPPILGGNELALIAEPRRYGLHATLKAPFALAAGVTVEALESALADFAVARPPVALGPLRLTNLKGFLALCPPVRVPALHALADSCVRDFDRFRAPASEKEIAKRRAARLTPAQDAYLLTWGYPYVLEEFQFHVTLTQRLAPDVLPGIEADLARRLEPALAEPCHVEDLALFEEPAPGAPFTLRRRFRMR